MRNLLLLCGLSALAACGGGGTGGSSPAPTPTLPPTPTLDVTLVPSTTTQTGTEVSSANTLVIDANFTGTSPDPITPDLSFDTGFLMLDGPIVRSGNSFRATLKSSSNLGAAAYSSDIRFRLCKESACTTVYPGSTKNFTYTLNVAIADWTTHQRNAAHNGYVHATFDPTKFADSWSYAGATSGTQFQFSPVVARSGTVYAVHSVVTPNNGWYVSSLNGKTGVGQWVRGTGRPALGGPALIQNYVVLKNTQINYPGPPTSHELQFLNESDGALIRGWLFPRQPLPAAQPTPYENSIFQAVGDAGNVVTRIDLATGRTWTTNGSAGQTWGGSTPAVDDRYVYLYSGNLDVFDRATGAIVKSINDPNWRSTGYTLVGGPMIGSGNHVIAYSSTGSAGATSFPLVDYDIAAGRQRWKTASAYSVVPAVANGVVYAATNTDRRFDAINEATGAVLWSWPLPAGETFVGNIVVTDTLVFVSTNAAVYAIGLDSAHASKWSAPTGGWLAITPDAKLIVAPEPGSSLQKIVAYNLR